MFRFPRLRDRGCISAQDPPASAQDLPKLCTALAGICSSFVQFSRPTFTSITAMSHRFRLGLVLSGTRHLHRIHVASGWSPPHWIRSSSLSTASTQDWIPVIGLEVHAQLDTRAKLFSDALNVGVVAANVNVSPIDAAFPGTLPRLNPECVELAVKTALALSCSINPHSSFDRKHYFYPDLPAGFQITQHWEPIARDGHLVLNEYDGVAQAKQIGIHQIQLEQDSGKSIQDSGDRTLVDLNRAGVPVLEIVTTPTIHSSEDAVAFLKKLHRLLWYAGISKNDTSEGSWRCDINVSVRRRDGPLGTRAEVKHVSTFNGVRHVIDYEVQRQIQLLQSGAPVAQETRGFNEKDQTTFKLRGKEEAKDYRYMPEPDLPPITLSSEYISAVEATLPEPLDTRRSRLLQEYKLSMATVEVLMDEPGAVEYYEKVAAGRDKKKSASWVTNELFGLIKTQGTQLRECRVSPELLGSVIDLVETGKVSGLRGKDIVVAVLSGEDGDARTIAEQHGWLQVSDVDLLEPLVLQVIDKHPTEVARIKAGKDRLLAFLVGQVMKATKGKANPGLVDQLVRKHLGLNASKKL
ncbi:amidotransferase subunit B [Polychytrium aggregatum]|uniref:amidotransferase subunit B n=1 Tax=Polychytrium aggregatum TaxID=110093 RepID=UPI0022FE2B6F|nr:amidotransferase subunit B [Polychytrium aggregatum]KAI9204934.1 amidotransferase subunit B [Polychytrium aggregatum]